MLGFVLATRCDGLCVDLQAVGQAFAAAAKRVHAAYKACLLVAG